MYIVNIYCFFIVSSKIVFIYICIERTKVDLEKAHEIASAISLTGKKKVIKNVSLSILCAI